MYEDEDFIKRHFEGVFDNECICVHIFTHMNAYVCICLHIYAYVCKCTHDVYAYACIYQDLMKQRALRGVFDTILGAISK